MKDTHACPKCSSNDILRLTDQSESNVILTNFTFIGAIYLTRFICANCGYSEQWLESPEDRERLRKRHQPF